MISAFRWFGPQDTTPLSYLKQAGVQSVVTALHTVPNGEVWTEEAIEKVRRVIRHEGMEWTVTESIPIHESIKLRQGSYREKIENYKRSLANVAKAGIRIVCYNFMPVLDWTRTDLYWKLPNDSTALRFDQVRMAMFEHCILKHPTAGVRYPQAVLLEAEEFYASSTAHQKDSLQNAILKGLPGTVDDLDLDTFKSMLAPYRDMTRQDVKANFSEFLKEIIPIAADLDIRMAVHPDDPPYNILDLPRILSTENDFIDLTTFVDDPANGITFCTGSLGAHPDNDLIRMIERFKNRIHFLHLRNVRREPNGSFYEDHHLEGSTDMFAVVKTLVELENELGYELPMRPDHGHQMAADLQSTTDYAGYTYTGRLKGLSELKGLEFGIKRMLRL